MIDIYLAAYGGATIWFADDKALQGTLINTLKEVRPTRFLGVPRVWEKIEEKMREIAKQNSGVKKAVANWAKAAAFEHHAERMAGRKGWDKSDLLKDLFPVYPEIMTNDGF